MKGNFTVTNPNRSIEEVPVKKVEPGDIMCWEGHVGFVHKVLKEEGEVELISYLRNVPDYEGVGYRKFKIQDDEKPRKFFRVLLKKDIDISRTR